MCTHMTHSINKVNFDKDLTVGSTVYSLYLYQGNL